MVGDGVGGMGGGGGGGWMGVLSKSVKKKNLWQKYFFQIFLNEVYIFE